MMIKSDEIVELIFDIVRGTLPKKDYKILSENLPEQRINVIYKELDFTIQTDFIKRIVLLPIYSDESVVPENVKSKITSDLEVCENIVADNL